MPDLPIATSALAQFNEARSRFLAALDAMLTDESLAPATRATELRTTLNVVRQLARLRQVHDA